jgi:AraC family transcriptional regulator
VRVACVKHRGTPQNVNNSAMKLLDWARENNHALKNGGAYGIAYDDPETTVPEKFRFDLCLDVGRAAIKGQDISEEIITGGKYAVLRHKGSHDLLGKKLMAMFKEWLPTSSEELRDAPCFFHYQNYVTDAAASSLSSFGAETGAETGAYN